LRRSSALAIGLALIVGACSGDDDDGSEATTVETAVASDSSADATADSAADTTEASTADTAAETTAAAAAETTAASAVDEPTGEPIKFAVTSAVEGIVGQPEVFDGADAATAAINAAGGIPDPAGGPNRPLEVVRCEAGAGGSVSPDVALECARATLDEGIIAVVGKYLTGADGTKLWQEAGVPLLGTLPSDVEDFLNPASYPITGGATSSVGGAAYSLQQAGATTIALVTGDVAAGRSLPGFVTPVLDDPANLVNETYLPLDPSADYTPQLTQLASLNPDGVALIASTDINVRAITGLRQAGYTGLIAVVGTAASPAALEDLGEFAEGIIVAGAFAAPTDEGNAGVDQFNAEMDEYAPDALRNDFSVNAWVSVYVFADLLKTLDTIDAASLTAAMNGYQVDLRGLAPPFALNVPVPGGLPRVFTSTFQPQIVEDGRIVSTGEFVDLTEVTAAG
jgi:ABC-type branched-subunit amino acid transport system substrate-binding protein